MTAAARAEQRRSRRAETPELYDEPDADQISAKIDALLADLDRRIAMEQVSMDRLLARTATVGHHYEGLDSSR